jgi:hypothetical protein
MLAASVVMGVVVFGLTSLLGSWFTPGNLLVVQIGALAALVGGGLLAYLATAEAFGAMEIRPLLGRLLRR